MGRGEPVMKPDALVKRGSAPSEHVLLVFTRYSFRVARRVLSGVERVRIPAPHWGALRGSLMGVSVCVVGLYFGAPASVMTLEMLIAAGARYFVVMGEAGAIHSALRIGDILLPSWGLREEGTSYHYAPADHVPRPSRDLLARLEENLRRLRGRRRIKVAVGGVWSTDAPFRETRDKVREYARRGILGVDMESTALMCVAEYRGVDLAVALAISDELHGEEWNPGFKSRKLKRAESLLVKASLATLASYSGHNGRC